MSWLDRQSFLGPDSDQVLQNLTVGLVGLGGGNSHVVQQLAHLGVGGFVLCDDDVISESNLNRLVGGTLEDVREARPKTEIAKRVVLSVNPKARIACHQAKWQEVAEHLRACDIIIGGVDRIIAKSELESFCRRFLIPYIDMGMDVHCLGDASEFLVAGQVVLSSPGTPCLRCLGVITDSALSDEAAQYGDAGGKPQVVWPNGILASTAVGLLVQLFTPWHGKPVRSAYYAYDANEGTTIVPDRFRRVGKICGHYPTEALGDPRFDIRAVMSQFDTSTEPSEDIVVTPVPSEKWFKKIFAGGGRWLSRATQRFFRSHEV